MPCPRRCPAVSDGSTRAPRGAADLVKRAGTDEGLRKGTTSQDAARIAEPEREVKELRRADAILKSASAFFAAELDCPLR
ncbi:hypothetical protein [Streptomyces sp. BE133]|uniref:hypothetical protein n=1 Tax=Streptomyces sp. BE133 TaxID=3002523 RepID=UPI002E773B80|nr:hypothetical protein [Streptomyces sp. BE133]MEE1807030.1 hypothetical protein [Streptomyces sp. BE133]